VIITKTPFRISFVGGGSDIEDFYAGRQGAVLSTSINKYMYISSHKFFEENLVRVKYSETETVDNISKLNHPILRVVLEKFNIRGGLEISSIADIPSGTGLGSSSSFTVCLLHNLYTVAGKFVTKERLAAEACEIEIEMLKEPIGKQDQYAAAYGGLNVFKFNSNGSVTVEPVHLPKDIYNELESNLLMFYTGSQRKASSILSEQKKNIAKEDKVKNLEEMVGLVWELRDCLYKGNLEDFGKILHQNWILKQKLASSISNDDINQYYEKAMKNGALGGKLLGAGGGGFLLFYCEKQHQEKLKQAMLPLKQFDFKFDQEGSKLIYVGE